MNKCQLRHGRITGGGPEYEMKQTSTKVIEMFGSHASFQGVPGGVESGTNLGDSVFMEDYEPNIGHVLSPAEGGVGGPQPSSGDITDLTSPMAKV